MKRVFVVHSEGQSEPMTPIRCTDEAKELQMLLENNFDLLAGEQITPLRPRRWLLVRKEMPVPDPNSGDNRWAVDFLFVDQDAVPTFVECKRFNDTRSRREVVGQVMEYVANGQFYWDCETMKGFSERTAAASGEALEDALAKIQQEEQLTADLFFQRVEENLKIGNVRIIFFMEEAPSELKSIVEFLNNQLDRTEMLIVEACQFKKEGLRVVAPSLFGYTEQARQAKRASTIETSESRRTWSRSSTLEHIASKGPPELASRVRRLLQFVDQHREKLGDDYGTGQNPSVLVKNRNGDSLLYVYSSGIIQLPVPSVTKSYGISELEALTKKYSDRLQWRGKIEPAKYPSLTKKLQTMNDHEEAALQEFVLSLVTGSALHQGNEERTTI
jgi:hypothetical protein